MNINPKQKNKPKQLERMIGICNNNNGNELRRNENGLGKESLGNKSSHGMNMHNDSKKDNNEDKKLV